MRSLLFLPLLFGFSGPAIADSEVFKIDVSAQSYRNHILSGTHRNRSVSGDDPTVTLNKGDIIIFDVNVSRHPLYIKTEFSRGGGGDQPQGQFLGLLERKMENYDGIRSVYQKGNTIMFVIRMYLLA